jgi:hypothetical protein
MRWIGRPGYAVRDFLAGNFEGAGRQALDFLTEPIDAALPGDWIPTASRDQDYTETSDLLGGMEDGLGKTAVNVLGGIATDPLTYLSFGATAIPGAVSKIAKGAAGANRAAGGIKVGVPFVDKLQKVIPGTEGRAWDPLSLLDQGYQSVKAKLPQDAQNLLTDTGIKVRSTIGDASRVVPWARNLVGAGRNDASVSDFAGSAHLRKTFPGYSENARRGAFWAINNAQKGEDGKFGQILDDATVNPAYTAGKSADELQSFTGDATTIEPRADLYPREIPRSDFSPDLNPDPRFQDALKHGELDDSELEDWVRHYLQKESPDLSYPKPSDLDASLGIKSMTGKTWKEDTTLDALDKAIFNLEESGRNLRKNGEDLTPDQFEALDRLSAYREWVGKNGVDPATRPDFTSPNILRQAYPPKPNEPKFASGLDLTNSLYNSAEHDPAKLFKEGADLGPGELPTPGMGSEEALRIARGAEQGDIPQVMKPAGSALEQMLGRAEPRDVRQSIELPTSTTDATIERMGGAKAGTRELPTADAPGTTDKWDFSENIIAKWDKRIDAMKGYSDAEKAEMRDILRKTLPTVQTQFKEAVDRGAFKRPVGRDLEREALEYVQRSYTGFMPQMEQARFGLPNATKERTLPTGKAFADFLNENPHLSVEDDLLKALSSRGHQQGAMLKRVKIGNQLIEDKAAIARQKQLDARGEAELSPAEDKALKASGQALADKEFGPAVEDIIKEIHDKGDRETAKYLYDAYHGLPPRGNMMKALDKLNVPFKKAAVMGVLIPRWAADVRNRLSAIPQVASTPGAEGALKRAANPVQIGRDLLGALDDAAKDTFGWRIPGSELTNSLETIDKSFADSGGVAAVALKNLRATQPDLADAMERGVLDGFVNSEQLVNELGRTGWKKTFGKFVDAPAKIFKGVEDRMRLGTYLDLRKAGKDADEAARLTEEAFFDYRVTSPENRNLRTLLPFAQFMVKAIPQQGKFISRNPALGAGLDQLYGQNTNEPIYPWVSEQSSVPLGRDNQGNLQVATGLGMPWESLNAIPNLSDSPREWGRDIERGIVASGQPGLKSLYSLVTGHDPYFRSDVGSYDKVPLLGDALGHNAGSAYNMLAGTGLIQPFDSPLRMADRALDSRKSIGARAIENILGANVVSVDQERALQQMLQQALEKNPTVHKHVDLYQTDKDPKTQKLLEELRASKARVKAEKKAAVSASP